MPANPKQIKREWERGLTRQANFRTIWQELKDYIFPNHPDITTESPQRGKVTSKIFDSAGGHNAGILAASLAASIFPPSQENFRLVMRQKELNDYKDVRDWLDEVGDQTRMAMAQSNHLQQLHASLKQDVVFGTTALFMEEGQAGYLGAFGGLHYASLPIGSYVVGEDQRGYVDRLIRRFQMYPHAVVQKWPQAEEWDEVKAAQDKEEPLWILHSVYPRYDRKPTRETRENMPYASCYLLDAKEPRLLSEGGFRRFPYACDRWEKSAGELYGRGRAELALPDIRSLNRAVEIYLAHSGKQLDPTLLVDHDSVLGQLTLEPAGIISKEHGAEIKPLESAHALEYAEHLFDRLERKISEVFYADTLRLRKPNTEMTRAEVVVLQEEMLRLMGPAAGSLLSDFMSPQIEGSVDILAEAGQLPPTPQELLDLGGDIDIEYQGPLARAQKSGDLGAIERVQMYRGAALQMDPTSTILDNFDLDEEARHYAQVAGYPTAAIKGEEQVQAIREERQKAKQAMEEMQVIAAGAEAAGKAAPMAKVMNEAGQQPAGART